MVAAQCDHCGYQGEVRSMGNASDVPRPGVGEVLARIDAGLGMVRHRLAAVLTVVAWTAAGQPVVGLVIVAGIWLLVLPVVRLGIPPVSADRLDETLEDRAALRRGLLAAMLAAGTTAGVLLVPNLGWLQLAMVAVLLAGAASEFRDAWKLLRSRRT